MAHSHGSSPHRVRTLLLLVLVAGGCGRTPLDVPESESSEGLCGNGVVDPGEACDKPTFFLVQGNLVRPITPMERAASIDSFYNYFSASGHTGLEQVGTSNLFLYRDVGPGGQLSLVTIHGADKATTSETQPPTDVVQSLSGLPMGTFVAISDDPNNGGEFSLTEPTKAVGSWFFKNNSDGGALSGLPALGAFSIEITSEFSAGITKWEYIDGSGKRISLVTNMPATIISLDPSSECRLDCTIPRCGDGIVDAGEVCDDGNTSGGDGCAADCRSMG